MTQKELADHIGCDVKVVNRIVNGRSSVTAEMAIRLGAALRMSPEFWLNAQQAVDIYHAVRTMKKLSTWFSHDALVGVKWNVTRLFAVSQSSTSGVECVEEMSRIT